MLTALKKGSFLFTNMQAGNLIRTIITSALLIILVVGGATASAETLEISGNASNSNNSIQLNQNNSNNVNQSNSADVNNSVNINSNTGGNSINGGVGDGSITTGNITNNVNINNQLNSNAADVKCKNCPTPTKKPGVSPTPTKAPSGPTPTTPPGVGGNGGRGDGGGDGGPGGVGGPSQAVLGLPITSGENSLIDLLKLLPAFGSLTLGYSLLRRVPDGTQLRKNA